ncbi:MAG: GGDEF domain-containing protein [Desulfobacterales bacterium]|nr:GGDEF domain-containing protein [Desulfobacterales bacterium]
MNNVKELEHQLKNWDIIRSEILFYYGKGDFKTAERLVRTVGTPKFLDIVPLVDYVLTFAHDRAKRFANEAKVQSESMIQYTRSIIVIIAIFIIITGIAIFMRVKFLQNELNRRATVDYLTGVFSRRHFMELAQHELAITKRYGNYASLTVADLDMFKSINDTYGHQVGDIVLKKFCEVCRQTLRDCDIIGRLGGEEFGILLPNTEIQEAEKAIERVKEAIVKTEVNFGQFPPIHFTASFGVAVYSNSDDSIDTLLKRADNALYKSKHEGRNKVSTSI